MLKGTGLMYVWKETLILIVMTSVFLGLSIRKFKIRLEQEKAKAKAEAKGKRKLYNANVSEQIRYENNTLFNTKGIIAGFT